MRLGGDFVHRAVPKFDLQPEATCASIIRYVSKPRNSWAYLEIRQTLTSSHAWHAKTAAPQAELFFKAAEGTKPSMERCRYPQTHCVASACGTAARSHGYKPGAWRSGASSGADCTSASGSCQSPSRCCRLRNASTPYPGMLTSCRSPPAADREGKALECARPSAHSGVLGQNLVQVASQGPHCSPELQPRGSQDRTPARWYVRQHPEGW